MLVVSMLVAAMPVSAADGRSLFILPFELIDNQAEVVPFPERDARLQAATDRLKHKIREEALYDVLESATADAETALQQQRYDLHSCHDCDLEIARKAGADRVLVAWVQRATALILNLNIEIRNVSTGAAITNKSSEIRGNTARNWDRAIDHMVRSMVERGQGNR